MDISHYTSLRLTSRLVNSLVSSSFDERVFVIIINYDKYSFSHYYKFPEALSINAYIYIQASLNVTRNSNTKYIRIKIYLIAEGTRRTDILQRSKNQLSFANNIIIERILLKKRERERD